MDPARRPFREVARGIRRMPHEEANPILEPLAGKPYNADID